MFQSPLGEVVKETQFGTGGYYPNVAAFQSPLGEVVKETINILKGGYDSVLFQSPLGEVVKETCRVDEHYHFPTILFCFNPLSGKW